MNHWIEHEKNEQLFFRFDGPEVRAIFTPRYKPVDNFEVMTRLDDMGYGPGTQVQCHLDGEFMLLSIPGGKQTFQVNGDKMTPGIKDAVEWAWPQEAGYNMFAVVNTYTRAAQFKELSVENSYQLQRVGGNILGMLQ